MQLLLKVFCFVLTFSVLNLSGSFFFLRSTCLWWDPLSITWVPGALLGLTLSLYTCSCSTPGTQDFFFLFGFFWRLFCQQRLMSDLWVIKKQIQAAHSGEPEQVLCPARFSVNAGPCPAVRLVIHCVLLLTAMQQARTVVRSF